MERYEVACKKLMDRFNSIIPEGSTRARIRASRRESHKPKEANLGSTLGEEATRMVVVDFDGHVMRYDQMNVMESIVAAPASTLEIEVPGPRGKGWRRTDSSVDTADDPELDDEWRKDLSEGARHMREETWIKLRTTTMTRNASLPCTHTGQGVCRASRLQVVLVTTPRCACARSNSSSGVAPYGGYG